MLAILPILTLALLIRFLYDNLRRNSSDTPWRLAMLGGATLWGTCIVLITEGLSLFHALTRYSVALSWTLMCIGLGCALFRKMSLPTASSVAAAVPGGICPASPVAIPPGTAVTTEGKLSIIEWISLIGLAAIAFFTLVIVLVAAPNNWDSLTYHLPRVMHWIQNHSVAFYVTPDARQICFPPWSEYHILQYQILLKGDRLAALPQWLAFAGSGIAASILARQFGANRRYQIFAAIVAGTLPMGILQATSTQNDLTAAFWLMSACTFGLALIGKPRFYLSALFGLAAGISLLTKTTAYLFAAPILLFFTFTLLYRHRILGLKLILTAGILALALNLPLYIRNIELCGHPLGDGPHHVVSYRNTHTNFKTLASNLMRNTGLQFMTPSTRVNEAIELGIRFGHKVIHADINDPLTTFGGNRYETKWLSTFEDDAANPLHFSLAIICLIAGFWWLPRGPQRMLYTSSLIGISAGAIIFCWLLMWQPFHSRQHVTLFLLATPLISVAIAQVRYEKFISTWLTVILLLTSFPYVFGNELRPLLFPMTPQRFFAKNIILTPREQQYMTGRSLPETWRDAAKHITEQGYKNVGLKVQWFSCEYPLWVILQESGEMPYLQHVGVTNMPLSSRMQDDANRFKPDAILRFSDLGVVRLQPFPNEMNLNGRLYVRTWLSTDTNKPYAGAEIFTPSSM